MTTVPSIRPVATRRGAVDGNSGAAPGVPKLVAASIEQASVERRIRRGKCIINDFDARYKQLQRRPEMREHIGPALKKAIECVWSCVAATYEGFQLTRSLLTIR